jgi:acyl-CoA thioester hydrolase
MPVRKLFNTEIKLVVPFHDVDPAQVVWHGHYIKYLEIVRCKLLSDVNYSYRAMEESGFFWPVVDLRIKYIRPLLFEQEILVGACVTEWEYRLKMEYLIRDARTLEKLTKAYTIQVAYDITKKEMLYESPQVLKKVLGID